MLDYRLTWRGYPGLVLCAVLYFPPLQVGQEWGRKSELRQRSGFRFYMSSENGCRILHVCVECGYPAADWVVVFHRLWRTNEQ